MDKELKELTREINILKRKKERELKLSSSYEERNRLLKEISQLEAIKKSPSKMKSFGSTFGKGLKLTSSWLWGAVKKGSKNLEKNDSELKRIGQRKQSYNQPYSDLGMLYLPQERQTMLVKMAKPKKLKKLKIKKLKFGRGVTHPFTWSLP